MIIILAGAIGRFPVGGHAWVEMQYLLGLQSLGYEVFYLEECGEESWVYNWHTEELTPELDYPTTYIRDCLESIGLGDKWIYRAGEKSVGIDLHSFIDICSQADLLIVRGAPITLWRDEYALPKRRVFIDVDPGFTQFSFANGNRDLTGTINRCERLFTIAQRIGEKDCKIPLVGREWIKTVSPVALPYWSFVEDNDAIYFTSILQWKSYKDVVYEGISYGNKDKEFPKYIDLPNLSQQRFKLALTGGNSELLTEHGWEILEGWVATYTPDLYRQFIQNSKAEFSVAKHGYILTKGGWLSDRSICYLASGRPVLVQDTGIDDWLPAGKGLISFNDLSEALEGIEKINNDYERHRLAARNIAEEYFAADSVLTHFINAAMS